MYMKEVNEKLFNPRGLKASIASTDAMRAVLRVPETESIIAPLGPKNMEISSLQRVLEAVRPYSVQLDLNVPEPTKQSTVLAKLSATQAEAQGKKNDKKALNEREKAMEKEEERERKEARRAEKKEREEKREPEREKKEKKRGKNGKWKHADSGSETEDETEGRRRESKKSEYKHKGGKKGKDKEAKNAGKLLWILIENV